MADYDLAIIGGGINGTGIARDAAGRGLRVLLLEQNDLGSGTSSASTKLIHGGLRYLEHGALRLVREALTEREVLLRMAPHLIRPMRFVLPAVPGPRSPFMLRLGLFLYDWLGARKILPGTRTVDLTHHVTGQPLLRKFRQGFEYSDCWADDSRLVVLNALDAAERGAEIRTRTRVARAERDDIWKLILNAQGRREAVTARVLVNAAGPWAGIVSETVLRIEGPPPLRLTKGSHIVVRKLFNHDRGYIFQNTDKRIVFALPFAEDFTLIGTTDQNFVGSLDAVAPSGDEVIYLCRAVNEYLREPVGVEHVVWAFAGVRSLYDASKGRDKPEDVTRDYHLDLDEHYGTAPVLTVYGGKITTHRRLAEDAVGRLSHFFTLHRRWTAKAPLPGGDFLWDAIETRVAQTLRAWPFLDEAEAWRLTRAYGTRVDRVMGDAKLRSDIAPFFGPLSAAEVRYLMKQEWARQPDDVLWRRSKLGLKLTAAEKDALAKFMAASPDYFNSHGNND
ncbi:MAG: glycerol-3-phosphate dehydrogenase [Alphaproteobacteria bacterium]|nr:glycerol-3-phosphate dehydrogenase [Alphaproteobacteria bacterium]